MRVVTDGADTPWHVLGVIVSPCVTRFGFRRAAMFGSILAATSIFVSSFSTTMPALIVTFGFLGGTGLGFMHIPAVVIVGHYFEKRRSFATGLVCSMGGIGAFIFAPMLNFFIAEYGWRGTFWLLSGIMLNGLVCACLYRVVDLNTSQTLGVSEIIIENPEKDRTLKEPLLQEKKGILPDDGLKRGDVFSNGFGFGSKESLHNKVISSGDDKSPINDVLENISENSVRPNGDFDAMGDLDTVKQQNDFNSLDSKNDTRADCQKSEVDESDSNSDDGVHTPDEVLQTVHSEAEDSKMYSGGGACQGFCRAVCKLLGLSLLKSPTFVTYTLSVFLWSAGLFVPPTYLPPLAYDLGIDSTRAAFLVSIIGFSNTLGRVVFGFVSDLPRVDPLVIKTVMVVVGGAATCTVPFLTTFPLLAAYCCVYGSSIGVYVTLRSPVLVDLVGLKNFTNAFGLLYMAHGIGGFVGSPLAIFLADATGNYKLSFFVIGAVFIVAGILCIPLRRIARWERRNLSTTK
nr:hypothetical protein BaRGS_024862 [Batillaria attramentaria]